VAHHKSTAVSENTPFDLASLTKPFTALTAAHLASCSVIKLSEPLGRYLPELEQAPIGKVTIEQALAHRTGLRAHCVLGGRCIERRIVHKREILLQAADNMLGKPRDSVVTEVRSALYSDLGYLIVGAALEESTGSALDSVVHAHLLKQLGAGIYSSRQWQARSIDFMDIVAPTEHVPWRGGTLKGVVHDDNAWAWAGYGIAGHAGLFATSSGVAQFGAAVIDALSGRASTISQFAANYCTAQREGGTLRAGFDGKSESNSRAGRMMSRHTFGHLGFTGTSIWCDPEHEVVIVVLSNRICPTRGNTRLPLARAEIHDQLFEWAISTRNHLHA
jgi:CubicO group peptidase (beta-lactamase class C family)